jgi:plastocyanin
MKYLLVLACTLAIVGCNRAKEEPSTAKTEVRREYYRVDPASAAKLRGTVRFVGRTPPLKVISMDAEEACEKLHNKPVHFASIVSGKEGELANVFVYVKSGLEDKAFEPPKEAVVLDQRGCMFTPRVVALRAGQTLAVKNSDPVSHNIHPMPQNSREWNQQQSPGAPDLMRRFVRPEVMIPVKCNVHSWMRSYIGVMDHPYFAVTGATGEFEWTALPPGEYTVAAWHEALGELTEKITVAPNAEATLTFIFRQAPSVRE